MSGKNLVRKYYSGSATWTAPAGVKQVRVKLQDTFQNMVGMGAAVLYGLTNKGAAIASGNGGGGTLGNGTVTDVSTAVNVTMNSISYRQIVGGHLSAFGVSFDGLIYGWGAGTNGVLGNNTVGSVSTPVNISGIVVRQMDACSQTAIACEVNGRVYDWGLGTSGQLGINTIVNASTVQLVSAAGSDNVMVAAAGVMNFALKSNGTVIGWGDGTRGGLGDNTSRLVSTPVVVATGKSFKKIVACGSNDTGGISNGVSVLGLDFNGQVWSWGFNGVGQLGDGTTTTRSTPVQVLGGRTYRDISMGVKTAFFIEEGTGNLYAVGGGEDGIIGNNTTNNYSSPVQVTTAAATAFISGRGGSTGSGSGDCTAVAVSVPGAIYGWGGNSIGQLGQGSLNNRSTPAVISSSGYWAQKSSLVNEVIVDVIPGQQYSLNALLRVPQFNNEGLMPGGAWNGIIILEFFA